MGPRNVAAGRWEAAPACSVAMGDTPSLPIASDGAEPQRGSQGTQWVTSSPCHEDRTLPFP